jgi:murein DD-endopeptidase MepM/ murein hydrolase activator NlpD
MNLKSTSKKVSQAILALALGFIICPESAKAASNSTLTTESLELSKPTLLVNSVKQVSMLVESSNTISSELSDNISTTAIDNVETNTYTIAKDNQVTPLGEVTTEKVELNVVKTANLPPQNSVTTPKIPSLIASSDTPTSTIAQSNSLPIPVEVEFQPINVSTQPQPISIPVEVQGNTDTPRIIDNSNSDRANNSINIPVVPSANEEFFEQQIAIETQESLENVERPTLISNIRTSSNQNFDPRSSRIINPSLQKNEERLSPDLLSSVPIQVEYYNPMVSPSAGEMVSPDLPQINSPDPYLPDNSRPFNGYIWPAKGVFTSGYGPRWGRMHRGIDIAAPVGTPIVAAAEGEVISAGWNSGGYGNLVKIRHFDGTVTLYAHNSKIHVRRGQYVQQGQHIANMGSTGFSTGPHLHFEIHPQGQKAVNPIALLPKQ